jgi:hypothetical protein
MARLRGIPNILRLHAVAFAGPKGVETDGFFLLDYCVSDAGKKRGEGVCVGVGARGCIKSAGALGHILALWLPWLSMRGWGEGQHGFFYRVGCTRSVGPCCHLTVNHQQHHTCPMFSWPPPLLLLLLLQPGTLLDLMGRHKYMLENHTIIHIFGSVCHAVAAMHSQEPPLAHRCVCVCGGGGTEGHTQGALLS